MFNVEFSVYKIQLEIDNNTENKYSVNVNIDCFLLCYGFIPILFTQHIII